MASINQFPIIPLNSNQPKHPSQPTSYNNFFQSETAAVTTTETNMDKDSKIHRDSKIFVFSTSGKTAADASSPTGNATAAAGTRTEEDEAAFNKDIKEQQEAEMAAFTKIQGENTEFTTYLHSLKIYQGSEIITRYDLKDAISRYPANKILPDHLKHYFYFRGSLLGYFGIQNKLERMIDLLMPKDNAQAMSTPASVASLASPISEGSPVPLPLPSPLGSPLASPVTYHLKSQMDSAPIQSIRINNTDRFDFLNRIVALMQPTAGDGSNIIQLKTHIKAIFGIEAKVVMQDQDINNLISKLHESISYAEKAMQLCCELNKIHSLESQQVGLAVGQANPNQSKASLLLELNHLYTEPLPLTALVFEINDRVSDCCCIL